MIKVIYNTSRFFFILVAFQLCSCKKENESKKNLISKDKVVNNFNYDDLLGKTFFVLSEEDGKLLYDTYGVSDMTEYISFQKRKIKHFMPMEVYYFLIDSYKVTNDQIVEIKTTNSENSKNKKSYSLSYDKEKHFLYSFENNTRTVYIDSIYLNKVKHKERSKTLGPQEKTKKNLVFLKSKINIGDLKNISIKIPFVKEHSNDDEDSIWGKNEIPSNLKVKMIRGKKGNLFSVDGEGKCGACPNFSAFYSIDGDLLCYAYSVRVSAYEGKTLLEKGDFEKVMSDYGITDRDLNIQYNHPKTPTYEIKNWY